MNSNEPPVTATSQDPERAGLEMQLGQLRQVHEDYKLAIDAMIAQGCNPIAVQRMKKRKLDLKDQIAKLHSRILPDVIA